MSWAQRIQRNPLLLLSLGAVLILTAAILIWVNLSARRAPADAASGAARSSETLTETRTVLFSTRTIQRGTIVGDDDVALRGVVAPAPSGAFGDVASVVGRVATSDILAGQIVLVGALSADRLAAGVAALVRPGERAFSVRVVEDQIVGGFLRVNDRVDIYVTLPSSLYPKADGAAGKEGDQSKSALLLQNVPVLAVGEKLATGGAEALNGVRTVTLAVSPEAVARLALADRLGKVALAIRNPTDENAAPESTVSLIDLGSMSAGAGKERSTDEADAARGHRITIYSGASTTTITTAR